MFDGLFCAFHIIIYLCIDLMSNPLKLWKMKKMFFFVSIALMAQCLISCVREDVQDLPDSRLSIQVERPDTSDYATIHFVCTNFEMVPFTRALSADGKDLTDLWVLDYVNGSLVQQLHQVSADDDFGTPTLTLSTGDHHIYFIASRGKTPTLNTDAHTITFGTVSDTFYKDYAISLVPSSSGSRSVTLDRCVTRLRITITDALPVGISTINITPSEWYYGVDYTTGEPIASTASQTITTNVPSGYEGQTNVPVNIFGFSPSNEWTTDVAINAKSTDNAIIGSVTIDNVPLKRNRITEYTGPLFSSSGATTVSLSTDWLDTETMTW
jgi:hypothetical protein